VTLGAPRTVTAIFAAQTGAPPSVSCSAEPISASPGETVTFTALASGGTAPYSYVWTGAVSGVGQSLPFQPAASGTYTAIVVVTDGQSSSAQASCSVVVGGMNSDSPYVCTFTALYDDHPLYVFSDGTTYAQFSLLIANGSTLEPITDFHTQVVRATFSTPNGNQYGPTDGPLGTGAEQPSVVKLPSAGSSLSSLGFGTFGWVAGYQISNNHCRPGPSLPLGTPLDFGDIEGSTTVPAPSITSLSPANGAIGTELPDITVTGQSLSGVTDVTVTGPSTLQGTVTPQDDETAYISLDLTGGNITSGVYSVSLMSFGALTNAVNFTVGDAGPVIDTVELVTPLYPGDQANVRIKGRNFGRACLGSACPGASVKVCHSGDNPCGSSDVIASPPTSWRDTEVDAVLSADSSATGFYDVVITSVGSTGTGFQSTVNAPQNPQSGPGTFGVSSRSLNVSAKVTTDNYVRVATGTCAYIDPRLGSTSTACPTPPCPRMPQIQAVIVGPDGNTPVTTGTASYQIDTTFVLRTKDPTPNDHTLTKSVPSRLSDEQSAGTQWVAPFPTDKLFGGHATLKWRYKTPGQPDASGTFDFWICGKNPSFEEAQGVISPTGYWFLRNAAIHETNMSQFCEGTRTAGSPYCKGDPLKEGLPIFGAPAGYGFAQIDPIPKNPSDDAMDMVFNWRRSLAEAKMQIDNRPGYQFWRNQVTQWSIYNASRPPDKRVPMAVDPPTNELRTYRNPPFPEDLLKSPNYTFTMSLGPDGKTTINTGVANPAWFGDAIVMKQQGGAPQNYISWDNRFENDGVESRWAFSKGNSVSRNIVYEFCTCSAVPKGPECKVNLKCGGTFDSVTLPQLPGARCPQ